MIRITYRIREKDWLELQLFAASQSEKIVSGRRKVTIVTVVLVLLCGAFFYMEEGNIFPVIFWGAIALAVGLFFPRYLKWRYKTHYRNYVRATIKKMAGDTVEVEITPDAIRTVEPSAETKVMLSSIESVIETGRLFIIKNTSAAMLAVPKDSVGDSGHFRECLRSLGVNVKDCSDWKW